MRSGTENVYGIAAFGQAVKEHTSHLKEELAHMEELKSYIIEGLERTGVTVNKPTSSAPHIISVTAMGIRSETLLHFLSSKGIYVSSGSACSSNDTTKKSEALSSFGLNASQADSTVRISLCPQNTKEEADALFAAIGEALSSLARK